jgi:glycosyltransferase involved in cell wall biosynthesis
VLRSEADRLFNEVPDYPLTGFYNPNMVRQVQRFATMVRRERICIVQTHDFYTNVFGMIASAVAGVPVRIAARREIGGVRTIAQKTAEHFAYRLAHAIVANAAAVGDQLVKEGVDRHKIAIVYNGLDFDRVAREAADSRLDALKALGLPADSGKRYVTIVANMRHPVKDHGTFLRAAARVAFEFPDAAFLLAGEGELLDRLRELAAHLGLADRVHFLGRCQSVGDLLALSEVCVLSSVAEGFPNAVLEYMGAGRPVVSTDVGGIRELVRHGETGYIVPVGDEAEMSQKILSLLRDPGRAREMGIRGKAVIEQRFSCNAHLSSIEALYNTLLANVSVAS